MEDLSHFNWCIDVNLFESLGSKYQTHYSLDSNLLPNTSARAWLAFLWWVTMLHLLFSWSLDTFDRVTLPTFLFCGGRIFWCRWLCWVSLIIWFPPLSIMPLCEICATGWLLLRLCKLVSPLVPFEHSFTLSFQASTCSNTKHNSP